MPAHFMISFFIFFEPPLNANPRFLQPFGTR
jgi:hypothetical protein